MSARKTIGYVCNGVTYCPECAPLTVRQVEAARLPNGTTRVHPRRNAILAPTCTRCFDNLQTGEDMHPDFDEAGLVFDYAKARWVEGGEG
jgi:hypothetical protein